jgi:tellurite resistance protein TehA-like permease/glutaredoxin
MKRHCPFCARIKKLFESLELNPTYLDIQDPNNKDSYKAAVEQFNFSTVPMVIIDGECLGGCDDTCIAAESGELQRRLNLPSVFVNPALIDDGLRRPPPTSSGFLLFPPVVNRWVAQGVALQVVGLSIIIIYYREELWAWWLAFAIALDFLVRFIAGGTPSVLGANALPFAALLPECLVPGPPKQFAAFLGLFFFGLACCLGIRGHGDTREIGGSVVVGVVMGAAALEAFLNFCLGCYFFGLANSMGIVPDTVYQPYTDSIGMSRHTMKALKTKKGWTKFEGVKAGDIPAENHALVGWRRKLARGAPVPEPVEVISCKHPCGFRSDVDVKYKFPKTDETIRESWGAQYIQFEDFGLVLGIAGLAAALRRTQSQLYVYDAVWQTVGGFAACIYGLMILALLYKIILFPRKFYMDVQHPFKRNAMVIIPINLLIFAYLLDDQHSDLQFAAWWVGASLVGLHFVFSVALFIKNRASVEHINPSLIFPPAACLVVAFVAPVVGLHRTNSFGYGEAGMWFFGFGLLFFLIILAATFHAGITYHWSDDRLRPLVTMWMAGCFIVMISYQTLLQLPGMDAFSYVFWASGVVLFLVNLYLIYPGRWLLRGRFEMANWAIAFPLDLFVLAAINYRERVRHEFSYGIMWVSLIFAHWANWVLLMHTLANLFGKQWPRPPIKWAPLSFNKLQHEAMRVMLARIKAEANWAAPTEYSGRLKVLKRLVGVWKEYEVLSIVHSQYEDEILFSELSAINPSQLASANAQHETLHNEFKNIDQKLALNESMVDLESLKHSMKEHTDTMLDHIQWEEDHLQPMIRRIYNLDLHAKIIERIWIRVGLSQLEQTIVSVVRNLPMHGQRVRYVKCLTWVLPERTQLIGLWLYRGLARDPLGDVKYAMLLHDMPEIAPRGSGYEWTRYL